MRHSRGMHLGRPVCIFAVHTTWSYKFSFCSPFTYEFDHPFFITRYSVDGCWTVWSTPQAVSPKTDTVNRKVAYQHQSRLVPISFLIPSSSFTPSPKIRNAQNISRVNLKCNLSMSNQSYWECHFSFKNLNTRPIERRRGGEREREIVLMQQCV